VDRKRAPAWIAPAPLVWEEVPEPDELARLGPTMRAGFPSIVKVRAYRARCGRCRTVRRAWLAGEGRTSDLYILEVDGDGGRWPTLEVIHDAILALTPGVVFGMLGGWLMGIPVGDGKAPSSVLLLQSGAIVGTEAHTRLTLSDLTDGKKTLLIT